VSEVPGPPFLAAYRPMRETLEALRLVQDYDGFAHMTLVKLDLVFERDLAKRNTLQGLEQVLEEMDGLDWPAAPAPDLGRSVAPDPDGAPRIIAEIAFGDLPCTRRPPRGAGRATGSRPLPLGPWGANGRPPRSGAI